MICDTSAAFKVQGTNSYEPKVAQRSAWHEYVEDGPRSTEGQRMQASQTPQAAACSLRAREG